MSNELNATCPFCAAARGVECVGPHGGAGGPLAYAAGSRVPLLRAQLSAINNALDKLEQGAQARAPLIQELHELRGRLLGSGHRVARISVAPAVELLDRILKALE
jgi:hypothetical protein